MPLPDEWLGRVGSQLSGDEKVLAWLAIDLNSRLRFAPGLIVLTQRRLLALSADDGNWQSHELRDGLSLTRRDHSGVGSLELVDSNSRLALWRYTLGGDIAAGRLIEHFNRQLAFHLTGEVPPPPSHTLGPNCETPMMVGAEECPLCSK